MAKGPPTTPPRAPPISAFVTALGFLTVWRLPFGSGDKVEQIVGSFKAISIEGGFKVNNLMGIKPHSVPAVVINAVIDQEIARRPIALPDDIVEIV